MIVDQRALSVGDRLLYRMQLLRDVEASSAVLDHFYDPAQVALRPLQPLDDLRVALMKVDIFQPILLSIRREYSLSGTAINSLSFRRSRGSARP